MSGISSFIGKVIEITWIGVCLGIFLNILIVSLSTGNFQAELLIGSISILMGIGFFIEALLTLKIFLIPTLFYWIGGIIVSLYPGITFYLFIFIILTTMIVPGIFIKLRL
ncbi:MAG: hypothetical protein ABIN61_08370 [candidate division WOR-3 bacterium]